MIDDYNAGLGLLIEEVCIGMLSEKSQVYGRDDWPNHSRTHRYDNWRDQARSMHRTTKLALRIVGIILIIVGVILVVVGVIQLGSKEMGDEGWFDQASGGLIIIFAGGAMILVGIAMLYVSFIGKIAKYYADETAPAFETAGGAVGRGLSAGTQQEGGIRLDKTGSSASSGSETTGIVIKTKCRSCGYLETEDADFCSKCGKRL